MDIYIFRGEPIEYIPSGTINASRIETVRMGAPLTDNIEVRSNSMMLYYNKRKAEMISKDCSICFEVKEVLKCQTCVFHICEECYKNWNKEKCPHCKTPFLKQT